MIIIINRIHFAYAWLSDAYRLAGKFDGENVWQFYSIQAFGRKKIWWMNRLAKGLLIVITNWLIADDLPPNFPDIQY